MDLPAMAPCQVDKRGRHDLIVVSAHDGEGDLTLICAHCGAARRMAMNGDLPETPMDDWLPVGVMEDYG